MRFRLQTAWICWSDTFITFAWMKQSNTTFLQIFPTFQIYTISNTNNFDSCYKQNLVCIKWKFLKFYPNTFHPHHKYEYIYFISIISSSLRKRRAGKPVFLAFVCQFFPKKESPSPPRSSSSSCQRIRNHHFPRNIERKQSSRGSIAQSLESTRPRFR